MYYYNVANNTWNFGVPLSTKYGWTYITVTAAEASHTGSLNFGYTFQAPPIVMVTFIGYQATGTPSGPESFDTGLTKMVVSAYAPTTTSVSLACYSGDGSNFPGAYNIGIAWMAIG